MSDCSKLFATWLLLAVILISGHNNNIRVECVSDKLAVNETIDGILIQVPYFDEAREVPKERRDFDLVFINDAKEFLTQLAEDIIVKNKNYFTIAIPYTKKIFNLLSKRREHREQLVGVMGPAKDDGYAAYVAKMAHDILRAKEAEQAPYLPVVKKTKAQSKLEAIQFVQDLGQLFDQVAKASAVSTMGVHIAWREAKFGDEDFFDIASKRSIYLQKHASGLIWVLKKLIDHAAKNFVPKKE